MSVSGPEKTYQLTKISVSNFALLTLRYTLAKTFSPGTQKGIAIIQSFSAAIARPSPVLVENQKNNLVPMRSRFIP